MERAWNESPRPTGPHRGTTAEPWQHGDDTVDEGRGLEKISSVRGAGEGTGKLGSAGATSCGHVWRVAGHSDLRATKTREQ